MNTGTIITIGREYGSGGREVGKKLAQKLEIPYYDKELLTRAAKETHMSEDLFEAYDEKPTTSFLYSLVTDTYNYGYASPLLANMPLNQKVFLSQLETIKKIADEGPCVIIGRCADYALAERNNCVNVFIRGDLQKRIRRIADKYDLTDAKAKEMIHKTDKKRASYYDYYSNKKWGDSKSYDLCINSSILGIDGSVSIISDFVNIYFEEYKKAKGI